MSKKAEIKLIFFYGNNIVFHRNGDSCLSPEPGCEADMLEQRAPGCNGPGDPSSLFAEPLFSAFNYEQKKVLANKGTHK